MLNNILVHFKLLGEQINQEKYIYPITVLKNKKYHLNLIKKNVDNWQLLPPNNCIVGHKQGLNKRLIY